MRIAAVVVHYSPELEDIRACVHALVSTNRVEQIIVVDNASPRPVPGDLLPLATIVRCETNGGLAAGIAAGVRHLSPRIDAVLLLNPDVSVDQIALDALAADLAADGSIAVAGPRLLDDLGEDQLAAREIPTLLAILSRRTPLGRTWFGRRSDAKHLSPSRRSSGLTDTGWILGACMLVRRHVGDQLGWFDRRFFLYFEDVDFCVRVKELGYRVCYDPRVAASHTYRHASRGGFRLSAAQRAHLASGFRFFRRYPKAAFGGKAGHVA